MIKYKKAIEPDNQGEAGGLEGVTQEGGTGIKEHLATPPMRIGGTSAEVAEALGEPVSTTWGHSDLSYDGLVEFPYAGKAGIFALKKNVPDAKK